MIEHSKPTIGKPEENALLRVIKSKIIYEGEVVKQFEDDLTVFIGGVGAVATSTGTTALHLALIAIGVSPGDEIIVPNYICRSVLNSILYCRATPVLCDISPETYNIDFLEARKRMTRKTKAIIVAHMFGCPADVDKFKSLGVCIIEDCAHAIGAQYSGQKVGSRGDLAIFSFEGTKYIITGEGGMVLANSAVLLKKLRRLKEPDAHDCRIKYTYRMTNLQAAIGRVQLAQLPRFIKRRREISSIYTRALAASGVELPKEEPGSRHIFHRYMIRMQKDTKKFMVFCYKKGVKVKRPVKPYLLNQYLGLPVKEYPCSARIMQTAVSLPIYPSLTEGEIQKVIATVKSGLCD